MKRRTYKWILIVIAVSMVVKNHFSLEGLGRQRAEQGLTRLEQPLENAPPALAFTTVALGGFRGLITNYLWMRATSLQYKGRYFETLSLANWITKLQPTIAAVWEQHAHNMAYNISREYSEPAEKWLWVKSAMELLRDEGIRYNPEKALLYRELAFLFQDKIGMTMDEGHMYYKTVWANEMAGLLGQEPDWGELADPQTPEARERVRKLREEYKLDPVFMQEVDETYGPLDWRLPEAHAIYWAALGLEKSTRGDPLILRRVIWQSMQLAFQRGRLILNPEAQVIDFAPNLAVIDQVDAAYERIMRDEPEQRDYIGRAHRNFLRDVVYVLYVHHHIGDSARWFQRLKKQYPEAVGEGQSLDAFVLDRVASNLKNKTLYDIRAIVDGLLRTAYYYMALDEQEQALGYSLLARKVHSTYQEYVAGQEERLPLPSIDRLKQLAVDDVLEGKDGRFSTTLANQLRTILGLPAAEKPEN